MNANQNPHHQQQQNAVLAVYINNNSQNQQINNNDGTPPMPPISWVKCQQQQHQQQIQQNSGPSYGALNPSVGNSFQQQQPNQQFYSTPDSNFNNNNANNSMFYSQQQHDTMSEVIGEQPSCFYQQQQQRQPNPLQQQQQSNFHFESSMKNSCDMTNSHHNINQSNSGNFYGGGGVNNSGYYQQPGNDNYSDYHQNNQESDYHRSHHHHYNNQNTFQNYFGQTNQVPAGIRPPGSFNRQHHSNLSQQHQQQQGYHHNFSSHQQQQTPYRRNSIESFATEPGDGYGSKYNTNTNMNFIQQSQFPKREQSSTISPMNFGPNNNMSFDDGNGYFCNNQFPLPPPPTQHQPQPPFFQQNINNRNQMNNMENFKSCSFERDDLKMNFQQHQQQQTKAASAVKHRSLSLSCSYSNNNRSDLSSFPQHQQQLQQQQSPQTSHLHNQNQQVQQFHNENVMNPYQIQQHQQQLNKNCGDHNRIINNNNSSINVPALNVNVNVSLSVNQQQQQQISQPQQQEDCSSTTSQSNYSNNNGDNIASSTYSSLEMNSTTGQQEIDDIGEEEEEEEQHEHDDLDSEAMEIVEYEMQKQQQSTINTEPENKITSSISSDESSNDFIQNLNLNFSPDSQENENDETGEEGERELENQKQQLHCSINNFKMEGDNDTEEIYEKGQEFSMDISEKKPEVKHELLSDEINEIKLDVKVKNEVDEKPNKVNKKKETVDEDEINQLISTTTKSEDEDIEEEEPDGQLIISELEMDMDMDMNNSESHQCLTPDFLINTNSKHSSTSSSGSVSVACDTGEAEALNNNSLNNSFTSSSSGELSTATTTSIADCTTTTISDTDTDIENQQQKVNSVGPIINNNENEFDDFCESLSPSSSGPQKISKRSFSEADKELVINTSAIVALSESINNSRESFSSSKDIHIPFGWKRQFKTSGSIVYLSPSGTKIRTFEELKNYISSSGTCKCGLPCPLKLESYFNFDPKVTNLSQNEEKSLLNLNETGSKRLLCNHKRKIPKSEDLSSLISSTSRDDLGDCGGSSGVVGGVSKSKKRKIIPTTSTNPAEGIVNENASRSTRKNNGKIQLPKNSPSSNGVKSTKITTTVPFAQQSPDTTTQTDMSPASSVSSESSSIINSSRPAGPFGKIATPSPDKIHPHPPASQSPSSSSISPNANLTIGGSGNMAPRNVTITNTNTLASSNKKKIVPKIVKRTNSPCPNIQPQPQVSIIPRGPQTPNQIALRSLTSSATTTTTLSSSAPPNASQLNQNLKNSSVTFYPVTSTSNQPESALSNLNLNTGYSILPIPCSTNTNNNSTAGASTNLNNTLQFVNLNANTLPLSRVLTTLPTSNNNLSTTLIQPSNLSLPSSITISMIGAPNPQQQQQQSHTTILPANIGTTVLPEVTILPATSAKKPLFVPNEILEGQNEKHQTQIPKVQNACTEKKTGDEKRKDLGLSKETTIEKIEKPKEKVVETKVESIENSISSTEVKKVDETIKTAVSESKGLQNTTKPTESEKSEKSKDVSTSSVTIAPKPTSNETITLYSNNSCAPTFTTSTMSLPILSVVNTSQPQIATSGESNTTVVTASNSNPIISVNPANNCSLIMQPQQSTDQTNQTNQFITTSNSGQLRYSPFFQTIQQPTFFLSNSTGGPGGQLIISQSPSQTQQIDPNNPNQQGQQSTFAYIDQNNSGQHQIQQENSGQIQCIPQTTMVIDPSTILQQQQQQQQQQQGAGTSKKKKKRLSKKQQQQQIQLQIQQQLLLQQLQQAQQQQAATIPLTLFQQPFNLGSQGFSLQPMNFFQQPTILTLPNLILNSADGTLFLSQSNPSATMSSQSFSGQTITTATGQTLKLGNFPTTITTHQNNLIAPKKVDNTMTTPSNPTILTTTLGLGSSESSDDSRSRQIATPDSSTNDAQLLNTINQQIIQQQQQQQQLVVVAAKNPPAQIKSKATTNSAPKRILIKQILPKKIDSTTPTDT